MIVNERVVAYINSLNCGNSDICNTIEKEAIADEVPIIRKEMGNLLKVLLQLVQPERILEVGTAVGYSSILMSENMPHNCTITTIENYDKRIPVAKNNFKRAGKEDVITLIEGDALEVLKTLDGMRSSVSLPLYICPAILSSFPRCFSTAFLYYCFTLNVIPSPIGTIDVTKSSECVSSYTYSRILA